MKFIHLTRSPLTVGLLAALLCLGTASASDVGWSTNGSRAKLSQSSTPITTHSGAQWSDYDPPALYPKQVTLPMQYITMADGVRLSAIVTLPADASGKAIEGRWPTVVNITDYNIGLITPLTGLLNTLLPDLSWLPAQLGAYDPYMVSHGYASVSIDGRGSGNSEGLWAVFDPAHEADDNRRTLDWVAAQGWSDGRLGLYGVSDPAIHAVFAAQTGHPAVKALFAVVPLGDAYRDTVGVGGNLNVYFLAIWLSAATVLGEINPQVLVDPANALPQVIDHLVNAVTQFQLPIFVKGILGDPSLAYDGAFWSGRSPLEGSDKIQVPTFLMGAAHDIFQRGTPLLYENLKHRVSTKLLLGSEQHLQTAISLGITGDGVPLVDHNELRWFDQYVKGLDVGAEQLPNVTQRVLGYEHMVTATDWPHPLARAQRYYLHGDGRASTEAPTNSLLSWNAPRRLLQQPLAGLCSISTAQWSLGALGLLPLPCFSDDRYTEWFNVVYQTTPLSQDMYINGPIQADLWVATTNHAATVSVRVDDVDVFGHATPLSTGLLNTQYQNVDATRSRTLDGQMIQPWHVYSEASTATVSPGKVMRLAVEVFPTAALLKAGHRLRVAIGPSNAPQGIPVGDQLIQQAPLGILTIYNDPSHPSSVVLPVVPTSALQPTQPGIVAVSR